MRGGMSSGSGIPHAWGSASPGHLTPVCVPAKRTCAWCSCRFPLLYAAIREDPPVVYSVCCKFLLLKNICRVFCQDPSLETGAGLETAIVLGMLFQLLFLDWKQAFDKVDHSAMMIALRRIGLHSQYLEVIRDLYDSPSFCTKGTQGDLSWGTPHTGIRQGCPLSPYLFVMVMSVMFDDVDRRLRTQGTPQNSWSVGKPVYDLEYADDTMLIGVTPTQLEDMLCSVQVEASLYGLSLNFDKTELLRHPNHPATIKFANGRNVPVTESVKYLGSQVTWEKPTKAALQARAQQAHVSFLKLQHVWQSKLSWKVKSRIFYSCIVPSYLHGLSTLTLEKTHFKTIDGWYFRYLRRALKSNPHITPGFPIREFGNALVGQYCHLKPFCPVNLNFSPNQLPLRQTSRSTT